MTGVRDTRYDACGQRPQHDAPPMGVTIGIRFKFARQIFARYIGDKINASDDAVATRRVTEARFGAMPERPRTAG
jgi:hypothetical protein